MILTCSATKLTALPTPTARIQKSIRCSAAAAASPGPGFLQFSGAGKSGAVSFTPAAAPSSSAVNKAAKPQQQQCSASPSPGPGSLQFIGAGKIGIVSFTNTLSKPTSVKDRLAAAGLAGVVAYGIFNTIYYTVAFLMVFKLSKVPHGQGLAASAQAAAKILAVVWAGSQVTKIPRAGAALLAVPFVDALMDFIKRKLSLSSKRDAFLRVIFPACVGVAVVLFGGVTLCYM
jgi:hypothetical protein